MILNWSGTGGLVTAFHFFREAAAESSKRVLGLVASVFGSVGFANVSSMSSISWSFSRSVGLCRGQGISRRAVVSRWILLGGLVDRRTVGV